MNFNYLGLKLTQTSTGITLDQRDYIESIDIIDVARGADKQ